MVHVTDPSGTFVHIFPGDQTEHVLDNDCICRPALAREVGAPDALVLLHFERNIG